MNPLNIDCSSFFLGLMSFHQGLPSCICMPSWLLHKLPAALPFPKACKVSPKKQSEKVQRFSALAMTDSKESPKVLALVKEVEAGHEPNENWEVHAL